VNRHLHLHVLRLHTVLFGLLLLIGCRPDSSVVPVADPEPGGTEPAAAVAVLNAHLQANDLLAFTRNALPPVLYTQLAAAWKAGLTHWPLDEMPLAAQYPDALATLSADNARTRLLSRFDEQLAGSGTNLRQMAELMTIFALEFIQQQDSYSASERTHYRQLVSALGKWARGAALSDRSRAEKALDLLIPAARETGLNTDTAFVTAGMEATLERLAPVVAAGKQVLALYGLELDDALRSIQLQVFDENGDEARVRMRYRLAGSTIDADIPLLRIDGRWYVADFVDNVTEKSTGFDTLPTEMEID